MGAAHQGPFRAIVVLLPCPQQYAQLSPCAVMAASPTSFHYLQASGFIVLRPLLCLEERTRDETS
jgi:hypothetical protein